MSEAENAPEDEIYLPDGRLNPAQTKGFPPSDEEMAAVERHLAAEHARDASASEPDVD